jgi:hypothetical protein
MELVREKKVDKGELRQRAGQAKNEQSRLVFSLENFWVGETAPHTCRRS